MANLGTFKFNTNGEHVTIASVITPKEILSGDIVTLQAIKSNMGIVDNVAEYYLREGEDGTGFKCFLNKFEQFTQGDDDYYIMTPPGVSMTINIAAKSE